MGSDFAMQQSFFTWTLSFTNLGHEPGNCRRHRRRISDEYGGTAIHQQRFQTQCDFRVRLLHFLDAQQQRRALSADDAGQRHEALSIGTLRERAAAGYEAYIHSAVSGPIAEAQYPTVTNSNARWRLPNTSLTLAPGAIHQLHAQIPMGQ
jgi:hypothetical protein